MSMLIAAFMFVALLSVCFAHLLWSIGRTWPIRQEKLLAQTVIGTRDIEHMPPRLISFGVAVFTIVSAVTALALADHDSGGVGMTVLGLPFAAIFLGRGIAGYTARFQARTPEPNFRLNDRRVYSPLCLAIGAGFLVLVVMRLL